MRPFNRSSMAPDGSGRDSYIVMDKDQRDGRAERKDQGNFMLNLRSPPKSLCHHAKGHETWYKPTQRTSHWSPPARRRSLLPQGDTTWADSSPSRSGGGAPGDKALKGIMKRTSSTFMMKSKPPQGPFKSSGPFLSSTATPLPSTDWEEMVARSLSPSRAAGRADGLTPSDRIDKAMLAKATSTLRLRARPQANAYSFGRPASLPGLH